MIHNHIREKILEKSMSLEKYGMWDLVWKKDEAQKLIISLMHEDIGICGGDVYIVDSDGVEPAYDNWYCQPDQEETQKNYFLRSKQKALEYITKYPIDYNENIFFSLVFTDIAQ